jgi:hypothetical protein
MALHAPQEQFGGALDVIAIVARLRPDPSLDSATEPPAPSIRLLPRLSW